MGVRLQVRTFSNPSQERSVRVLQKKATAAAQAIQVYTAPPSGRPTAVDIALSSAWRTVEGINRKQCQALPERVIVMLMRSRTALQRCPA